MAASTCFNQPDFDYRREEGVNQSSLKKILDSPAHYKAAISTRFLPTPAMEMGTALHCLVLDGQDAFDAQYIKKPADIKLNTKEGRDWKEAAGRKKVLTVGGKDDPWGAVNGMAEALRGLSWFDPSQQDYIKHNEVSIYWDWEQVACKARLDRIHPDESIVIDLKTTDSVDPELFQKKVVGLGYDFQARFYANAAEEAFGKPFRFIFVAVERKPPFSVGLFEASEEMMAESNAKCISALRTYKACTESGEWPNREPVLRRLDYPRWYVPFNTTQDEEDLF
jgi:hypothetical protein